MLAALSSMTLWSQTNPRALRVAHEEEVETCEPIAGLQLPTDDDCNSELKLFSRTRPAHQGPACICAPNLGALAISTQLTMPLKTLDRQHSDPMTPLLRKVV